MTRTETISTLETFMSAWPEYRLTDATITLWCEKFAYTDQAQADRAAQLLIDNNGKFPTVAEMRTALRAVANRPRPFTPRAELESVGPMTPEERHEHGQQWIARCRAALHGTPPTDTDNEDERGNDQ